MRKASTSSMLLTILLAFVFQTSALSQIHFPDTPAGKRAMELMELFNSGDAKTAEEYVTGQYHPTFLNAFPRDQHVGIFAQVHTRHQKLELAEINASSETEIDATLFSQVSGAGLKMVVQVEGQEPYKITMIGLRPAAAPASAVKKESVQEKTPAALKTEPSSKPAAEKTIQKILDALIEDLVDKDEFSGTVLVAKNGKPFYKKAAGLAHKGHKVPNRIDTKFCLGSMNKMFTGTAIVQLEQQGKLSFEDKVGKHLPNYPNESIRNKVTIHHLLSHTSGMGQYWQEFFQNPNRAEIKTVADYDNLANKNPLDFEPGDRFSYSNCGPLVLGLIIEKISGMSYDEYIRKYVTGPAGMVNTDCYDITIPVENLAEGYTKGAPLGRSFDGWRSNLAYHPVKGGPAGGGYSTVEDLLRFDIALRNGKLLDEEHFTLMTTGKTERNPSTRYAYLFQEKFVNGHRIIGHNGGAAGVNSHLSMYMDLGYTVAVQSNYDPPAAEKIAKKLEELLAGGTVQ